MNDTSTIASAGPSSALAQGFSQVGHTCSHLFMLLYPTVVLSLEKEFDMSYGDLLVLMTTGNVLFGLAALPAGWLGDRWSTVGMMVIYFIGLGCSAILTGLMSSTFGLAVGLAMIGLFASIYHPVGMAWLVRNAKNRGRTLGLNGVFGSLGVASAAVVAGVLTEWISWRAAFILPGIAAVLIGLALAFLLSRGRVAETRRDVQPHAQPHRDSIVRAFVVLSITMLCNGLIFQSMSSALPKIFAERISGLTGGTVAGAGVLVSLVYFAAMGAQLVGGYLSDRYSTRTVYIATSFAQLPLYALAASLFGSPLFVAVLSAVLLQTIASPAENVLLSRYTPDKWRGTAFGAKFVLALGVGALGVPIVAYIHETTMGFAWYFVFLAFMSLAVVLAALLLPGERPAQSITAIRPEVSP
jgi:MFS transporter, FSR family, fosmidomycin resistance protein